MTKEVAYVPLSVSCNFSFLLGVREVKGLFSRWQQISLPVMIERSRSNLCPEYNYHNFNEFRSM